MRSAGFKSCDHAHLLQVELPVCFGIFPYKMRYADVVKTPGLDEPLPGEQHSRRLLSVLWGPMHPNPTQCHTDAPPCACKIIIQKHMGNGHYNSKKFTDFLPAFGGLLAHIIELERLTIKADIREYMSILCQFVRAVFDTQQLQGLSYFCYVMALDLHCSKALLAFHESILCCHEQGRGHV